MLAHRQEYKSCDLVPGEVLQRDRVCKPSHAPTYPPLPFRWQSSFHREIRYRIQSDGE